MPLNFFLRFKKSLYNLTGFEFITLENSIVYGFVFLKHFQVLKLLSIEYYFERARQGKEKFPFLVMEKVYCLNF